MGPHTRSSARKRGRQQQHQAHLLNVQWADTCCQVDSYAACRKGHTLAIQMALSHKEIAHNSICLSASQRHTRERLSIRILGSNSRRDLGRCRISAFRRLAEAPASAPRRRDGRRTLWSAEPATCAETMAAIGRDCQLSCLPIHTCYNPSSSADDRDASATSEPLNWPPCCALLRHQGLTLKARNRSMIADAVGVTGCFARKGRRRLCAGNHDQHDR